MAPIYLDNASTTRLDPRVAACMLPFLAEDYAHPSSSHFPGRRARAALDEARASVAALVGCEADEVVFTASATEANNLALKGIFRSRGRRGGRLLVSAIEHPSVLDPARTLAGEGVRVKQLPVDPLGRLDLEVLRRSLEQGARLVSVMHGNAEIGTIQPTPEAAVLAREAGALFHTDASVTAGLFPGLWRETCIDLMTVSPHLFHGPKGIAALVVRKGTRLRPQEEGGIQESGLRAGTEPVALAAGFGAAARLALEDSPARALRLSRLSTLLRNRLEESLPDWVPTGDPRDRIPGHLSLCLRYVEGEAVLGLLDEEGIVAASGSACTREVMKESHVLKALGLDPELGRGAIQFSFGLFNRDEDLEELLRVLPPVVDRLRRLSPLTPGS